MRGFLRCFKTEQRLVHGDGSSENSVHRTADGKPKTKEPI